MRKNIKKIKDNELLLLALERLKQTTGIYGEIRLGHGHEDARLVLDPLNQKKRQELIVEVKHTATDAAAVQLAAMNKQYILVTAYVNAKQADRFKNMGLQFLDCAGNAYIDTADKFLFIKGNKLETQMQMQPARLFKPGGLQVIFAFLCKPDLIRATYRDVAAKARVALGTVAWVIKDLKRFGYIIEAGKNIRRLVKREALLKTWMTGYEQLLRPKLLRNRYHAENQDWWQNTVIENAVWGGEVAANKMTGYLKPEQITIYADILPDRLIIQHRLRLDPKGEIEWLTPFWDFDYPEKKIALVPPLLVYADLLVRADGRTIETARMVYEQYLTRYFTEN